PRSERLAGHPKARVFDLRSLTFVDAPTATMPADRDEAADGGAAADWVDDVEAAAADPSAIIAVDHLEYRFADYALRKRLLACIESLIHGRGATVWVSVVREPVAQLDALGARAPDRGRWVRLLADFRRDQLPIAIDAKRARALVATLNRVESRAAAE